MERVGIQEKDLIEKFIRCSGPGGQHVNKVETGVYLRHLPTGIEVKLCQERSQALNRFLARRILTEKIEARIFKIKTERERENEKVRRQKRKRSKRTREKLYRLKQRIAEKKELRKPPLE